MGSRLARSPVTWLLSQTDRGATAAALYQMQLRIRNVPPPGSFNALAERVAVALAPLWSTVV